MSTSPFPDSEKKRSRVIAFMRKYAPQDLYKVDSILEASEEKRQPESQLFDDLRRRYKVATPDAVTTSLDSEVAGLRSRLVSFYRTFGNGDLTKVDMALNMNVPEEKLFDALYTKYNVPPEQRTYHVANAPNSPATGAAKGGSETRGSSSVSPSSSARRGSMAKSPSSVGDRSRLKQRLTEFYQKHSPTDWEAKVQNALGLQVSEDVLFAKIYEKYNLQSDGSPKPATPVTGTPGGTPGSSTAAGRPSTAAVLQENAAPLQSTPPDSAASPPTAAAGSFASPSAAPKADDPRANMRARLTSFYQTYAPTEVEQKVNYAMTLAVPEKQLFEKLYGKYGLDSNGLPKASGGGSSAAPAGSVVQPQPSPESLPRTVSSVPGITAGSSAHVPQQQAPGAEPAAAATASAPSVGAANAAPPSGGALSLEERLRIFYRNFILPDEVESKVRSATSLGLDEETLFDKLSEKYQLDAEDKRSAIRGLPLKAQADGVRRVYSTVVPPSTGSAAGGELRAAPAPAVVDATDPATTPPPARSGAHVDVSPPIVILPGPTAPTATVVVPAPASAETTVVTDKSPSPPRCETDGLEDRLHKFFVRHSPKDADVRTRDSMDVVRSGHMTEDELIRFLEQQFGPALELRMLDDEVSLPQVSSSLSATSAAPDSGSITAAVPLAGSGTGVTDSTVSGGATGGEGGDTTRSAGLAIASSTTTQPPDPAPQKGTPRARSVSFSDQLASRRDAALASPQPTAPQPSTPPSAQRNASSFRSTNDPQRNAFRQALRTFYEDRGVQGIDEKIEIAMRIDAPEEEIWEKLRQKYGDEPTLGRQRQSSEVAVASSAKLAARDHLRRRLVDFYQKHNPDNMGKVEAALALEVPEDVLFKKLYEKYGLDERGIPIQDPQQGGAPLARSHTSAVWSKFAAPNDEASSAPLARIPTASSAAAASAARRALEDRLFQRFVPHMLAAEAEAKARFYATAADPSESDDAVLQRAVNELAHLLRPPLVAAKTPSLAMNPSSTGSFAQRSDASLSRNVVAPPSSASHAHPPPVLSSVSTPTAAAPLQQQPVSPKSPGGGDRAQQQVHDALRVPATNSDRRRELNALSAADVDHLLDALVTESNTRDPIAPVEALLRSQPSPVVIAGGGVRPNLTVVSFVAVLPDVSPYLVRNATATARDAFLRSMEKDIRQFAHTRGATSVDSEPNQYNANDDLICLRFEATFKNEVGASMFLREIQNSSGSETTCAATSARAAYLLMGGNAHSVREAVIRHAVLKEGTVAHERRTSPSGGGGVMESRGVSSSVLAPSVGDRSESGRTGVVAASGQLRGGPTEDGTMVSNVSWGSVQEMVAQSQPWSVTAHLPLTAREEAVRVKERDVLELELRAKEMLRQAESREASIREREAALAAREDAVTKAQQQRRDASATTASKFESLTLRESEVKQMEREVSRKMDDLIRRERIANERLTEAEQKLSLAQEVERRVQIRDRHQSGTVPADHGSPAARRADVWGQADQQYVAQLEQKLREANERVVTMQSNILQGDIAQAQAHHSYQRDTTQSSAVFDVDSRMRQLAEREAALAAAEARFERKALERIQDAARDQTSVRRWDELRQQDKELLARRLELEQVHQSVERARTEAALLSQTPSRGASTLAGTVSPSPAAPPSASRWSAQTSATSAATPEPTGLVRRDEITTMLERVKERERMLRSVSERLNPSRALYPV